MTDQRGTLMNKTIQVVGNVAGGLGAAVCLVSVVARVLGTWTVAGVQISALFNVGMGLMVFACLSKLHLLTSEK
jgi:hypothetical protein